MTTPTHWAIWRNGIYLTALTLEAYNSELKRMTERHGTPISTGCKI